MQSPCRLTYVGQDNAALAELTQLFSYTNYIIESIDPADRKSITGSGPLELWPAHDWYRVVLLDIDVSTDAGLRLLARMRDDHAGIPVIVVANREGLRLTQQSLSWMHGADALVFKPLRNAHNLENAVADAVRRLDRWRETLEHLEVRSRVAVCG